jgi:2-haloacid dehalogenase
MKNVDVLFFDILGTVVDWRGSITDKVEAFLKRHDISHIDARALTDTWVGQYDRAIDPIRKGQRSVTSLDTINRENLETCLAQFNLPPSQFDHEELNILNHAWHTLDPWPDAVEGITRLKEHYIVAPLSDGHTRLLINMAKHAHLPWDMIFGADMSQSYKPSPRAYLHACELLNISPQRAMLVAAHDYDLEGARSCGLKTAFVPREHGANPSKETDAPLPDQWDYKAGNLLELAALLNKIR